MKKTGGLLILIMLGVACKKEMIITPPEPLPVMNYVHFNDRHIKFYGDFSFDLNGDGSKDILFYTQLVGDPELKRDYKQYILTSSISTFLPYNTQDQIPVLEKGAPISISAHPGYEWFSVSEVVLAQKTINVDGSTFWEGGWNTSVHKYIPVQINKNHLLYYGWIEISFDTQAEDIILHNAAVSKEEGKMVKAGL